VFYYCEPDKSDEENKSKPNPDPRCDYLLVGKSDNSVRFIELKGKDKKISGCRYCEGTWVHGLHQLAATFNAHRGSYEPKDFFEMILCTSIPESARKGRATRYSKYGFYKEIWQASGNPPKILYQGESDYV